MAKVYLNQKQMAAVLGVTTRSVRTMHEQGIPYEREDGKPRYPVPECVKWYFAGDDKSDIDMGEARRRFAVARAEREELRLDKERGHTPQDHPDHDKKLADIVMWLDVALKQTASRFVYPLAKVARIDPLEAQNIMHGVVQAQRVVLGGRAKKQIGKDFSLDGGTRYAGD